MSRPGHYVTILEAEVPGNVRFDVPARLAGQMVEHAYGGTSRGEHDYGDPYERITDRSDRSVRYGRWVSA